MRSVMVMMARARRVKASISKDDMVRELLR
jgi:hypothetical protein